MRAIRVDEPSGRDVGAVRSRGFWRRLTQALEDFFADRTSRAVPAATLRRTRQEMQRCRRLMLKDAIGPVAERVGSATMRGIRRSRQPQ